MTRSIRALLLPLAALALVVGACDDPTQIEGHVDAEGLAIVSGTTELYRYMLEEGTPSPLTLTVGRHDVAIVLLDHDGEPLPHEGGEDEEELILTIADESIFTWTPEAEVPGEVHETEEFHGELNALAAGSTTMEICLLHAGHCDFRTPEATPIPVTITQ
ncbi:MAG: hypothetical protein KY466_12060 [Gemmatimonadetes bacterium]|nr:hypothetical protein [Gemmatimonadota bacterium]